MKSQVAGVLCTFLTGVGFGANADAPGHSARFTNDYIVANVSLEYPGFESLSLDSLGKEHFPPVTLRRPSEPSRPVQATRRGSRIEYRQPGAARAAAPRWAIEVGQKEISLESHWSAEDPPEPLVLDTDNSVCHVTLLGRMNPDGSIQLPAVMHFPDQGSFRISATPKAIRSLGYATGPGDMAENQSKSVRFTIAPLKRR